MNENTGGKSTMKKHQKMIALFVVFAFLSLLQISAMPQPAESSPDQAGTSISSPEKAPNFIEEEGYTGYHAKKKSIVPIILIGVGVAAVAAVLFLVVLKTKYDITGTWEIHVDYSSTDYTDYTSTWVFTGSKESGTFVENFQSEPIAGTYKVTNNKDVWFKYDSYTDTYVGKFDSKDKMSGTFSAGSTYNGTWTATKKSSNTAASPAPQAKPLVETPKAKKSSI
jgi:hypothetical protein